MSSVAVWLTAGCTASAGLGLTAWGRTLVGHESSWLRHGTPALLAGLGGVGSALLARSYVELLAFAVLAVACGLLVVIDLASHRLPDAIVGPTYPVLFVLLASAAAVVGDWGRLGRSAAVAAVLMAGYFVLAFIAPDNLGLGDVKLSGLLGAFLGWLGWSQSVLGTLAAFAVGGVVALLLVVLGRAGRRTAFAFGPCMVVGAALGAGLGPTMLNLP